MGIICINEEEVGKLLVEKFWWLINSRDGKGDTPIDIAKRDRVQWAVELLSRARNNRNPTDHSEWIGGTPLHHRKLKSVTEYKDFMQNPFITQLKNIRDQDGATPLYRALERKDIHLAEALLSTPGVKRGIPNQSNQTANDILANLCNQHSEWKEMYDRALTNLGVRYVRGVNMNMSYLRHTLSVVAALLATLTFAAGFTIPSGFNSKTGDATSGKKPVFLVFILADTIAMCCSMLALFCLIWSMVCESPEQSMNLVDRSVVILMGALYFTFLTFATGVFTVIFHQSRWAAILICALCLSTGVLTNKTVLNTLFPDGNQERGPLLQKAKAIACCRGDDMV